jgi:2Fe-2S ferredoxin
MVVRVEPLGVDIDVRPGESIMAAAQRGGYYWPTQCQAMGSCTVCFTRVKQGAGSLSPAGAAEAESLERLARRFGPRGRSIRLACQAKPTGDVVVVKPGVKPVKDMTRPYLVF